LIALATGGLAFVYKEKPVTLVGLLHPLADALKFIFKEDFVPAKADRLLFQLAPIITLVPAVLAFAVIPFSDTLYLDVALETLPYGGVPTPDMMQSAIPMQVASLDIGILFIFAVAGTGVVGAAIGGYASDNKFSLMGGIRAAGQMVSYEVALGLTLVPVFMYYGTLRLDVMVNQQANETFLGILPAWSIFHPIMWLPFILYVTASIAETKRIPFDLPEGESELVGGYFTEYSGMKFGMFFFAEFIEVIALAALAAAIFFGGWDTPFIEQSGIVLPGEWEYEIGGFMLTHRLDLPHVVVVLIQLACFIVKIAILIFMQLQIRWTLPRFRYDQIMALCWKVLLPLALLNVFLTGAFILWNPF
jgi:NADH-quinone oxidoreductase subunit H